MRKQSLLLIQRQQKALLWQDKLQQHKLQESQVHQVRNQSEINDIQ